MGPRRPEADDLGRPDTFPAGGGVVTGPGRPGGASGFNAGPWTTGGSSPTRRRAAREAARAPDSLGPLEGPRES